MLADPFEWSEAVLGKEPAEYCRWIKVGKRSGMGGGGQGRGWWWVLGEETASLT